MERQLNIWRQRNVSLEGKILLAKTFGISQIIYSLQTTHIKQEDIKRIENIVYKFIWNIKPTSTTARGRIKRETMQCEKDDGGLKAPRIEAINEAIKYKVLIRSLTTSHPISTITKFMLETMSTDFKQDFNKIKKPKTFLESALTVHNKISKLVDKDIKYFYENPDINIHKSYYQFMANHHILGSPFINSNQTFMVRNINNRGIQSIAQLKIYKENNFSLEAHQIWNTIPIHWRAVINRSRRWQTYVQNNPRAEEICTEFNKWVKLKYLTTSIIKNRLMSQSNKSKSVESINIKFQTALPQNQNPFCTCNKMTSNVQLRNVQYKILHNAFPTMKHLFYWGHKDSPNCVHCNVPESTQHAIWDCPIAGQAVNKIKLILDSISTNNCQHTITKENFIFGYTNNPVISMVFTLLKRKLILQREEKNDVTDLEIKNMIKAEYNVEKYIHKKHNTLFKFEKRWKNYDVKNMEN